MRCIAIPKGKGDVHFWRVKMPRGMRTLIVSPKVMMSFVNPPETWGRDKSGGIQPNVSPEMRFGLQPIRWRVVGLYCIGLLEKALAELIKILEAQDALLKDPEMNREDWLAIIKEAQEQFEVYKCGYMELKAEIEDGP